MKIVPPSRPLQTRDVTDLALARAGVLVPHHVTTLPVKHVVQVALFGSRGYYRDAMGVPGKNDRGIYDDAIILRSGTAHVAFNANTDPSVVRKGRGTGASKGIATLKPGLWFFTLGLHQGKYLALRQSGKFTVVRDGIDGNYEDTGDAFGINIHKGGYGTTSSLGCQTIFPDQWPAFIALVQSEMKRAEQKTIPYVLVENPS